MPETSRPQPRRLAGVLRFRPPFYRFPPGAAYLLIQRPLPSTRAAGDMGRDGWEPGKPIERDMPSKAKPPSRQSVGRRVGTGAGKGDGWGGSAQGETNRGPGIGRLTAELQALHDGAKEARLSALKANLLHLAFNAEREETQLSATNAALDREMGKPVSRNEMTGADGAALHPGIQVTFVKHEGG